MVQENQDRIYRYQKKQILTEGTPISQGFLRPRVQKMKVDPISGYLDVHFNHRLAIKKKKGTRRSGEKILCHWQKHDIKEITEI